MGDLRPLRVAFIHPDLGIGGAERLIVDAAVGLQNLGHEATIYTSHWDKERCFQETRDGTLNVRVLGDTLPTSIYGKFYIVLAILRQLHLTLQLLLMTYFSSDFLPPDLYLVDQLSTCIPILRWLMRTRVLFYCHFPDLLLSPGRSGYVTGDVGNERRSLLRAAYRLPIDMLEEATTAQADRILVNSLFTARMFQKVFSNSRHKHLEIIYPGIQSKMYFEAGEEEALADDERIQIGKSPAVISINRYEPKKNVALAIDAYALALKGGKVPSDLRLIIAGGYDERIDSCVHTLRHLQRLADSHGLSHSTDSRASQILFLTNLSDKQKLHLMRHPNTRALLYTPSFEHLGIVPLEAMACGVPVVAVNNGGPMETVKEGETGLLRSAVKEEWAEAIVKLVNLSREEREGYRAAGRKRIEGTFDVKPMAKSFETSIRTVVADSEYGKLPDFWLEPDFLKLAMALLMGVLCFASIWAAIRFGASAEPSGVRASRGMGERLRASRSAAS